MGHFCLPWSWQDPEDRVAVWGPGFTAQGAEGLGGSCCCGHWLTVPEGTPGLNSPAPMTFQAAYKPFRHSYVAMSPPLHAVANAPPPPVDWLLTMPLKQSLA